MVRVGRLRREQTFVDVAAGAQEYAGELAFGPGSDRDNHVKVAVLAGSITAAALAGILLRARSNLYQRLFAEEAADPDHDGTPNAYQSDQ